MKGSDSPQIPLDVLILGGGPAGMAAGLVTARARLDTLVINAESPRSAVTKAAHGFLSRDGIDPLELQSIARAQYARYPKARYLQGQAVDVSQEAGQFKVTLADGANYTARRLVIATGFRDDLARLSLTNIESFYGRSIFPCPFCDGFEHADQQLAIFTSLAAAHFIPIVRMWSDDLVVFSNGASLDPDFKQQLATRNIPVYEDKVLRLVGTDGQLRQVELSSGQIIEREAGFVAENYAVAATNFAEQLGVPLGENPWGQAVPKTDEFGATQVKGVYVVGDAGSGFSGITAAAREGSKIGERIVFELAEERW